MDESAHRSCFSSALWTGVLDRTQVAGDWTFGAAADPPQLGSMGFEYLWIIFFCGLATAIIGKAKGSSFCIWFLVGAVLPIIGLIAVVLSRREKDEPERQCPNCLKAVKLYVQVCPRCGTDLYLPDPRAVRHPGVRG